MKDLIKFILQSCLGYRRYLGAFAWFKVKTLHWDPREASFFHFLKMVPPDALVLDIGANLGFLSVHLARRVSRGSVIAFEPMPDNIEILRRTLKRFGVANVHVEPVALGSGPGELQMILPVKSRAKQQGLAHVQQTDGNGSEDGVRFKVPVNRLDAVESVMNAGRAVSAIKMDVENFERFVLEGALELIRRDRPLIYLELMPGENRDACLRLSREFGYDVRVYEREALVAFDPPRHANCTNFFFCHSGNGQIVKDIRA